MDAPIFEYPVVIQEIDADSFGHLNNAVYLRLFEQARWQFISDRGYGIQKIQETALGPVILEVNLRFMRELKPRENVVIKSQSKSFSGKIGTLRQWIEKESGDVACEALFTVGFWDIRARKLVSATDEWKHAVGISSVEDGV